MAQIRSGPPTDEIVGRMMQGRWGGQQAPAPAAPAPAAALLPAEEPAAELPAGVPPTDAWKWHFRRQTGQGIDEAGVTTPEEAQVFLQQFNARSPIEHMQAGFDRVRGRR